MKMTKKTPTPRKQSRPAYAAPARERVFESDSTYFLKLVVCALLGTLWLKFGSEITWQGIPVHGIPLGLLIGLPIIWKFEPYQSDRKIWYAILLIVTLICYFVPAGIVI